jgi:hypothetical protein
MFDRLVVVTKPTALAELLRRHHTRGQVRFYLESRGEQIEEYQAADKVYRVALAQLRADLPTNVPRFQLERANLPSFLFRASDLVIVLGPDGLFVNVAKYLDGQLVLNINPDPERIDGVLMRHAPNQVGKLLTQIQAEQVTTSSLKLAEAVTNDGQRLFAVNDFLVGRRDQISARYRIKQRDQEERQSSSGVLISTGVGSTGWLTSLVRAAQALTGTDQSRFKVPFAWDAPYLAYAVREPFPSRYTGTSLVLGRISAHAPLLVTSEMSEGGVIFSDGVPEDALEFNAGVTVTIAPSSKSINLVD